MITSQVYYEGDLKTRCLHYLSKSEIITDSPIDNKGEGRYFSPTDLFATSLASCILTIMGIIAKEHNFSIDGTFAEVTKIMQSEPRRIGEIIVKIYFPALSFTEKQKNLLQRAVDSCPIALSLNPEIKQNVILIFQ